MRENLKLKANCKVHAKQMKLVKTIDHTFLDVLIKNFDVNDKHKKCKSCKNCAG